MLLGEDTALAQVFHQMNLKGLSIVGIKKDDQLLGVIDRPLFKSYLENN